MGIRFECGHCGHTLHVKDYLAGKRGVCPHCQGKIDIPSGPTYQGPDEGGPVAVELRTAFDEQPTREMRPEDVQNFRAAGAAVSSDAPTLSLNAPTILSERAVRNAQPGDPLGESPASHWYVLPPGSMTKYGPALGDMMRSWLDEGRVAADALVWREGWPQWRAAASVFPQLAQTAPAVPSAPQMPEVNLQPQASSTRAPVHALPGGVTVTKPVPQQQVPNDAARFEATRIEALPVGPAIIDEVLIDPVAIENVPAVVLGIDDAGAAPQRAVVRKPSGKRLRDQQSLIVGLLVTLIVILLPILIYVLLHQR